MKQQPRYTLKLWHKGRMVLNTTFWLKGRFSHFIGTTPWQKAYIKVLYLPDVYNDGEYTNKTDLVKAWRDFIDADLVRSTYQKQW